MSRILVVEDEAGVRALVAEILRDDGFDVVEAASGDEALDSLLLGESYDLVLTDIDMPGDWTVSLWPSASAPVSRISR